MQSMYGCFTLPRRLYKNEDQVWDDLSKRNLSICGISTEVLKIYKTWLDKLMIKRNDSQIHPLDFPLVRFCLNPDDGSTQTHLFTVERPETIQEIYARYGEELADSFYQEISAKPSYQFMNDMASLNAEFECAKFLDTQDFFEGINSFHPEVRKKKGAFDAAFVWKNTKWYAEAKNMLHEDGNLVFISHILAGMLWLEKEGKKLREWGYISLEGKGIDNDFRKQAINLLRDNIERVFSETKNKYSGVERFLTAGTQITKWQKRNILHIAIKSQNHSTKGNVKIELTARRAQLSYNTKNYSLKPQAAYYWPEPLSRAFWKKLKEKIEAIKEKIALHNINKSRYLGFINLELHDKRSDHRKDLSRPQDWKRKIKKRLDEVDFPIVLHTQSLHGNNRKRVARKLTVLNKTAIQAGFKVPGKSQLYSIISP